MPARGESRLKAVGPSFKAAIVAGASPGDHWSVETAHFAEYSCCTGDAIAVAELTAVARTTQPVMTARPATARSFVGAIRLDDLTGAAIVPAGPEIYET